MVAYRVYCMIFWRPLSSLESLLSWGMTAESNCIMMEAEM